MKKYLLLVLVCACSASSLILAENTNDVSTPARSLEQSANQTQKLTSIIKRIDQLIQDLYDKDKIAPLSEKDLQRLDRLQEARMLAELKLQVGSGDEKRLEELLSDTNIEAPSEVTPQKVNKIEEIIPQTKEAPREMPKENISNTDLESILKELRKNTKDQQDVDLETIQSRLKLQASATNEQNALNIPEHLEEEYRQILSEYQTRIDTLTRQIDELQQKITLAIDEDYPEYSVIYEHSHNLMELTYERAITQIELRRDLRSILTPEQMKRWLAQNKKNISSPTNSEQTIKAEAPVRTAPKINTDALPDENAFEPDEDGIVYVPMRLVPVQTKNGRTVYQAQPLKKQQFN
ncbi:MAG: hypothetical protein IJU47_01015 [Verrucomicrobia bacterium]|nr:hypothetical protein [Verrucomicrobiota bacterium]